VETGAGGGSHRLPGSLDPGFTPFAWLTGVTSPRHDCRGGLPFRSLLDLRSLGEVGGEGGSILMPWSGPGMEYPSGRIGGDRCLGLLTQAVA